MAYKMFSILVSALFASVAIAAPWGVPTATSCVDPSGATVTCAYVVSSVDNSPSDVQIYITGSYTDNAVLGGGF